MIEAHQKTGTELPVNMKFCFEGMEESGSEGLEELVIKEAKGEFADVDAVCISDNYWCVLLSECSHHGAQQFYPSETDGARAGSAPPPPA